MRFIDRTIQLSFLLGAVLFVFLAPFYSPSIVWGLSAGLLLSIFNLWALRQVFNELFQARLGGGIHKRKVASYIFMKLPIFYGSVFLVIYFIPVSLEAFAVGFGLPLGVMVLKSIGQRWSGEKSPFLFTRLE